MHGRQTSYTNRAFTSLQFGVFYRIVERTIDFYDFFAELKWSGRVYTLMAVSGLSFDDFLFFNIVRMSILGANSTSILNSQYLSQPSNS